MAAGRLAVSFYQDKIPGVCQPPCVGVADAAVGGRRVKKTVVFVWRIRCVKKENGYTVNGCLDCVLSGYKVAQERDRSWQERLVSDIRILRLFGNGDISI